MTTPTPAPTTAELLKYSDLRMAAEALLVEDPISDELKTEFKTALKEGKNHSSKFNEVQAQNVVDHWQVVAQEADNRAQQPSIDARQP